MTGTVGADASYSYIIDIRVRLLTHLARMYVTDLFHVVIVILQQPMTVQRYFGDACLGMAKQLLFNEIQHTKDLHTTPKDGKVF